MSSPRNKRKRTENDAATAPMVSSRRRSREQRAAAPEPAPVTDDKNEQPAQKSPQGPQQTKEEISNAVVDMDTSKSSKELTAGENISTTTNNANSSAGNAGISPKPPSPNADPGSGPSQQENSSSRPASAESFPTNAVPVKEKEEDETSQAVGGDRASRIRALLSHRRTLLHRIKLCRSTAQDRLQKGLSDTTTTIRKSEGDSKNPEDKDDKPLVGVPIISGKDEKEVDEEIAAFREMTRLATLEAKKNRGGTDGAAEKRTSLSLRRGSSVGKRMNAALSSLAPGGSAAATADAPAAQPLHVPSAAPQKFIPKAQPQVTGIAPKPPFDVVATTGGTVAPAGAVPIAPPAARSIKSAAPPTVQRSASVVMPVKYEPVQKNRAPNSKLVKSISSAGARMSSSARPDPTAIPLHLGAASSMLPQNRLAQPVVNFPEAVALREQRSRVRSKLAALLERQKQRKSLANQKVSSADSASIDSSRRSKSKSTIPKSEGRSHLPRRRKTHWDHVLQEMTWMATDFIEERKWKLSAARTLGSAIVGPGFLPVSRKLVKVGRDKNSSGSITLDAKEEKPKTAENPSSLVKSSPGKLESQESRQYAKPKLEDTKAARSVSSTISRMMSELGTATLEAGALCQTDHEHVAAFHRFQEARDKMEKDELAASQSAIAGDENGSHGKDTPNGAAAILDGGDDEAATTDEGETRKGASDEKSLEAITDIIEKHMQKASEIKKKVSKSREVKIKDPDDFTLTPEQKDALELFKQSWDANDCTGAILSGPVASGKTIIACTMIWNQRLLGPQLLVCPPASVIRWTHELRRFKDMRIISFGFTGGISNPSHENDCERNVASGDVIVCEYSLVSQAISTFWKQRSNFQSLTFDCRHPVALSGSFGAAHDSESSSANANCGDTWNGPTELLSANWWSDLTNFFLHGPSRRLLIECPGEDSLSLSTSGLGDRQQIDILAFRAALVVGPTIFYSPVIPLLRKILSWARRHGKKAIAEKSKRVRKVFRDVTQSFSFHITGELRDKSFVSQLQSAYQLRGCPLPPTQREEYDKTCSEIRGSISSCIENAHSREDAAFHSFKAVSSGLLRLRRQCAHSRMSAIFESPTIKTRLGPFNEIFLGHSQERLLGDGKSGVFFRRIPDSPSQPDSEIASSILEGSGKLRELVKILKFDCDYKIVGEDCLLPLLDSKARPKPSKSKSSKQSHRLRKVAILAVLPDVQMLVSTLLSSIGINHDLLLRASSGTNMPDRCNIPSLDPKEEKAESAHAQALSLAWAEHQSILSKFNSDSAFLKADVIVASPGCVAGYGGLGVESADYIICLDEDWSGRSEFLMKRVLARWLAHNRGLNKDHPRLIRLVSADTIEEKLLATAKANHSEPSNSEKWPLSPSGHFFFPMSSKEAEAHYIRTPNSLSVAIASFPGVNLMKLRGDHLSDVLVPSKELPPLFASASSIRFLPFSKSADTPILTQRAHTEEAGSEIALIKDLLMREKRASLGRALTEHRGLNMAEEISDSTVLTPFCIFPPTSASFPKMMMTRKDLFALSTRFYLERLVRASLLTGLASVGIGGTLAQLPNSAIVATVEKPDTASATVISSNSDLADAWHKSGLSCKPDDLAASLLFYRMPHTDDGESQSKVIKSSRKGHSHFDSTGRRSNSYARAFTSCRDGNLSRDGNQGCEPVVYFPPLFPMLQECSIQAGLDAEAVSKRSSVVSEEVSRGDILSDGLSVKRKDDEKLESLPAPNSKRPRVQPPDQTTPDTSSIVVMGQPQALPVASVAVQSQPAQSVLKSPELPLLAASPHPIAGDIGEGALVADSARVISEDEGIRGLEASGLDSLGEDYGLLGIGAVALPTETIMAVANDSIVSGSITNSDRLVGDGRFSSTIPCDVEESEIVARSMRDNVNIDCMVLFVKKKSMAFAPLPDPAGQLYRPQLGVALPDTSWSGPAMLPGAALPSLGATGYNDMNGGAVAKKPKKKTPTQGILPMPVQSFSAMPSAGIPPVPAMAQMPTSMQVTRGKDGFRQRLLASFTSRQIGTGLTMFESASYRVAAARVQNRISQRFARLNWKSSLSHDAGPGVPLSVAKQQSAVGMPVKRAAPDAGAFGWESIAKRLKKNATTGDSAKLLALSQRNSLKRSMVSPCRVDFGPFCGGFLSLPSGMTGISPPKSRLGVSLPMGVKVPQALRDQQQHTWTSSDNLLLQECAVRFGMNWMLVARALSGLEGIIVSAPKGISEPVRRAVTFPRSARQCRDRWEALARSNRSIANGVRKSERDLRENARLEMARIPGGDINAIRVEGPSKLASISLLSKPSVFISELSSPTKIGTPTSSSKESSEITTPAKTELDVLPASAAVPGEPVDEGKESASVAKSPPVMETPPKPRRSFGAMKNARSKKQGFPLTIPGAVGNNPPTLAASHPSHMQSVQESAAAQSSSGRTEMWPLQILDVADKQRAASAVASSQEPAASTTTTTSSAAPAPAAVASTTSTSSQRTTSNGPGPSKTSTSSTSRRPAPAAASTTTPRAGSSSAGVVAASTAPASFPPVPASSGRTASSSQKQQPTKQPSTQPLAQTSAPPPPSASSSHRPPSTDNKSKSQPPKS